MAGELPKICAMALLAIDRLLPVRILAGIALIAVICAFVYVLRHLRQIGRKINVLRFDSKRRRVNVDYKDGQLDSEKHVE